jgi:ATP-dependent Clp protease, protease subunit
MIKITNTADTALVQIFGDIGESMFSDGWTLEKFKGAIDGLEVPNLTVELKSNGGDLLEAFAIHDAIKNLSSRVTVKIVGASASAATVIASGADIIEISENSRYLVHNAMTFVQGNKEELKDAYDQLASMDNQILNIYVKRTGKSKEVLSELMQQEKWLTAEDALEWGFVDKIILNKIENKMADEVTPDVSLEDLQAENEALKAKVEELQAKLDELNVEAEIKQEEEITAVVENAIKQGKLKKEQKEAWINLGKLDNVSMTMAIDAIYVPQKTLTNIIKDEEVKALTKETFMAAFKAGDYKGNIEKARTDFKEVYGYNPQF